MGNYFEAASAICSYSSSSTADAQTLARFQQNAIRLTSLFVSLCLLGIGQEVGTSTQNVEWLDRLEILDLEGLDEESLQRLKDEPYKVELVWRWLQNIVADGVTREVLCMPPPALA